MTWTLERWKADAERQERELAEHRQQERQQERREQRAVDALRAEMHSQIAAVRAEMAAQKELLCEAAGEALGEEVAETKDEIKKLIEQRVTQVATTAGERLLQVQFALHSEFEQRQASQAATIREIDAAVGNIKTLIKEQIAGLETKLADRVIQGKQGPKGDVGEQGPAGKLPVAKHYVPGAVYYQADVVTWEGATWQALRDTAREPSLENKDWLCLAARGADARSPTVRGTYNNTTRYSALDVVVLDGGSFVARIDDPGVCPGPNWQLLAKQGKVGPKGLRGEPGPRGEPGVSLRGWKIDQERYVAVPILFDGREGPVLELRPLFEQFFAETNRTA